MSEYFLKCIVRFLASHVELFLRKKKKKLHEWEKKKSVYSICKSVLTCFNFLRIPHSARLQCGTWPRSKPGESRSQYFGLKRLVLSSRANTMSLHLTEDFV